MKKDKPSNLAASVRQRLLNLARAQKEDFQLILTRYALERLLYRLTQSKHAGIFVLKGAMLFQLWSHQPHRPTRDLDLLVAAGQLPGTKAALLDEPVNERLVDAEQLGGVLQTDRVRWVRIGIGIQLVPDRDDSGRQRDQITQPRDQLLQAVDLVCQPPSEVGKLTLAIDFHRLSSLKKELGGRRS